MCKSEDNLPGLLLSFYPMDLWVSNLGFSGLGTSAIIHLSYVAGPGCTSLPDTKNLHYALEIIGSKLFFFCFHGESKFYVSGGIYFVALLLCWLSFCSVFMDLCFSFMCMFRPECIYVDSMCNSLQKPGEGARSPGIGVRGSRELPNVGARNRTQSSSRQQISHLSSPPVCLRQGLHVTRASFELAM